MATSRTWTQLRPVSRNAGMFRLRKSTITPPGTAAPSPSSQRAGVPFVVDTVVARLLSHDPADRITDAAMAEASDLRLRIMAQAIRHGQRGEIAAKIVKEVKLRLQFLVNVGLDYLALDRSAETLSGGEAQRIRLAAQLGSNLRGVCYILDEPTIGLHPRDNRILLDTLAKLEAKGNTLLVVEHDEDTIRRAAHVIDLGPGAGKLGGKVIAEGSAAELTQNPACLEQKRCRTKSSRNIG